MFVILLVTRRFTWTLLHMSLHLVFHCFLLRLRLLHLGLLVVLLRVVLLLLFVWVGGSLGGRAWGGVDFPFFSHTVDLGTGELLHHCTWP